MISNDPFEKRRFTYSHVWWNDAFTDQQLDEIETHCSQLSLDEGKTVGETIDHRSSNVRFVDKNESTQYIFDTFNTVIDELNNQFYKFDLYGYSSFQYTTYNAENLGKYDWHTDIILDHKMQDNMREQSTRKLSLVMVLNKPGIDFTGGEFQINLGSEETATTLDMTRGKMYAFPSFIIHRVKPVLTGVRKSIVIWVEGPKFV
jgi:PKHD-type hydroxylase